MKIAVIDVAAERGGALSVLTDFIDFINNDSLAQNHEWYIYISVLNLDKYDNIHIVNNPIVKKSWVHRLYWDNFVFSKIAKREKFDYIVSLQNAAVNVKGIKQIVYFHNALLITENAKFSLLHKGEAIYWLYSHILGKYTLRSLRKASKVIVQTKTIEKSLKKHEPMCNIETLYPNVKLFKEIPLRRNKINGFIYPVYPEKYRNCEVIVEAVRKLALEVDIPQFELLFTFKGNENEYATKIFNAANGISQIKFIDYLSRDDLFKKYEEYVLIGASSIETFSYPLVEVMQYNNFIISCDCDYALEVLDGYPNKMIYENKNVNDLAVCMRNVLINNIEIKPYDFEHDSKFTQYNCWNKLINQIEQDFLR